MRLKLFWKLGLSYLLLLFLGLLAVDLYTARLLRQDYLRAGFEQLTSLAQLAAGRSPPLGDSAQLKSWTIWMAQSGARITVIDLQGQVLVDSAHDAATMENHSNRPEIRQALAHGQGQAVRHSDTLDRDLVYVALRQQTPQGTPVVVRLALPMASIDAALADMRWRLLVASLVILLAAGAFSLLFSRSLSRRIERLKLFSRRVADGDFRPVPVERAGDELAELARALNETASQLDQTIRLLIDERNRSAAILSSMSEGVAVIGSDERVLFCNRSFCRSLKTEEADCHNRPLLEIVREPKLVSVIRQALSGHQPVRSEVAMGAPPPRSFAVTATPVEAAGTAGVVLVLHDISELQRLERVRRDFVANVSHEFKTPLTAIQGFAETLLGGALEDPEHSRRFLGIIREHASHLGRLTDDLLKLSQIEAGRLELELGTVQVAELVSACVETTRLAAQLKQLSLGVDYPPNLPAIRGDSNRLREVLQNLLDNAVQYTAPGGSITIRAAAGDDHVVLAVLDNGIGIPQPDQKRIFERFYRVDAGRSRQAGGTGLGLSIARHLVEMHEGRIEVESEVGRGSTFSVILPAVRPEL